MEHFNGNIHGWCNFQSLYVEMVALAKDNSHFVEIGCWKGKSASFMCVEIANSGKKIKFDCVDTWKGSEEHQKGGFFQDDAVINDVLYETFLQNMQPVIDYFNPIRLPSVEASKLYENESLDFVFIDAAHDYENVKKDVLAWLPKVKVGGYLAGDDYRGEEVARAVHEILGVQNIQTKGDGGWPSWFYIK